MFFSSLYQKFLEIFIYPSLWAGAGVASLSLYFQNALDLPLDLRSPFLILFTSLFFYNLDRIFDSRVQTIPDDRLNNFFKQRFIFIIVASTALASMTMLFLAPDRVRLISLEALIPLLYGMPLLKLEEKRYRLKDIPGSKAILVAGTITYAIVALPLAYSNANFSVDRAIILTLFLLILTATNAHLFDFRDLDSDRSAEVLTLPLIIGVKATRILFTILNILVSIVLIGYWISKGDAPTPITIGLSLLLNLIIIWWIKPTTPRNIYNILVDGCLFLPCLLVVLER